ncbi:hypothetical protein [Methylobacterium nigriterrae]|uniref:hypothetical protein n=1 Tax=Methylobacterium nigriterrae TaxID=3127512 RepID=UPI0030133F92
MPHPALSSLGQRRAWAPPLARESATPTVTDVQPPVLPLDRRLDCLIDALPVRRCNPGPRLMRAIRQIDPARSLVLRAIRLADGRRVDLVALPRSLQADPGCVAALRTLQERRRRCGRPLRLIREEVVDREPRLSNAQLVGGCRWTGLTPRGRQALLRHLRERGGSASLAACLGCLAGEADPAGAILALVAGKVLQLDLDRPLGPESWVRLGPFLRARA